ncbi:MAG TPA: hypothetical protein VGF45_12740, partial [Polyangia bacterium]
RTVLPRFVPRAPQTSGSPVSEAKKTVQTGPLVVLGGTGGCKNVSLGRRKFVWAIKAAWRLGFSARFGLPGNKAGDRRNGLSFYTPQNR